MTKEHEQIFTDFYDRWMDTPANLIEAFKAVVVPHLVVATQEQRDVAAYFAWIKSNRLNDIDAESGFMAGAAYARKEQNA